jgi:trk/ktr system potassium uptake protein
VNAHLNLHDFRLMLWVPAAMSLIMVLAALIVGEGFLAWAFVPVFLAVLAINFALKLCIKTQPVSFSTGETLATVALAWAVIMLLGAIPFWICSLLSEETAVRVFQHPLNGLFESVSGFTSTGLTMVNQPSKLPLTLQFWRSFMEWIGGVGLA